MTLQDCDLPLSSSGGEGMTPLPDEIQARIAAGETPDKKPLPCPYCEKEVGIAETFKFREYFADCECGYTGKLGQTKGEAIRIHNALCRLVTLARKYAEIEQEFGSVEECVELARLSIAHESLLIARAKIGEVVVAEFGSLEACLELARKQRESENHGN